MPKQLKTEGVQNKPQSLLPHNAQSAPKRALFVQQGHNGDTKIKMRPPSEPVIDRSDPNKYFVSWNHDVPPPLWHKYDRRRIRIKKYDIDNRVKGEEREQMAEHWRKVWKYNLQVLKHNPFELQLEELLHTQTREVKIKEKIKVKVMLSEEDRRKQILVGDAFKAFLESRKKRKLEPETIAAYQGCIDWITDGLSANEYYGLQINQLRHIHLSAALDYSAGEREWNATTINKGVEFMMTVFNWLATQDYIDKNPSKGKFIKLPTQKSKHRWYDKDTKDKVINAIKGANNMPLLRACQFTYWLLIRSKKELQKLRVGDIDRRLKRVRFSADLSKNSEEVYRDYSDEFAMILDEMDLDRFPQGYFIFGAKDGTPGDKKCGHNYFSKMFMAVKTKLELSMDYTVYGFKHTRIVHELMKGTDGYMISHMARHNDPKSTKDYQRDYDITLLNVYGPGDLTF